MYVPFHVCTRCFGSSYDRRQASSNSLTAAQVKPDKVLVSPALLGNVGAAGGRTCWESTDGVLIRLGIWEQMMGTGSSQITTVGVI